MNYFPKSVFFLLALVAPVGAHTALAGTGINARVEEVEKLELSVELVAKFHSWADEHEKSYGSDEEKMKRLQIWIENDGEFLCCLLRGLFRLRCCPLVALLGRAFSFVVAAGSEPVKKGHGVILFLTNFLVYQS